MPPTDVKLVLATSPELKARCITIRKSVFVEEQGYTQLDEDNQPEDAYATHFLLAPARAPTDSDSAGTEFMGTARLLPHSDPDLHTYIISRFALLPPFRGGGNGARFLKVLEDWVVEQGGFDFVILHAQNGYYGFYERAGYVSQTNVEYLKDNIPHKLMRKDLRTRNEE